MKILCKPLSILLSLILIFSMFTVIPLSAEAGTVYGTGESESVSVTSLQEGDILMVNEDYLKLTDTSGYTLVLLPLGYLTETYPAPSNEYTMRLRSNLVIKLDNESFYPYIEDNNTKIYPLYNYSPSTKWSVFSVDHQNKQLVLCGADSNTTVCTVTWEDENGTTLQTKTVTAGTVPEYMAAPVGTGMFLGWSDGTSVYRDSMPMVISDTTFSPVFLQDNVQEIRTIINTDEWNDFAFAVEDGVDFSTTYVILDGNFNNSSNPITTAVGSQAHPFNGIFDGNGKTLNIALSDSSATGLAPFRFIENATIKNLKTAGSVSGSTHSAGLVGFNKNGTSVIENVTVSVDVTNPSTNIDDNCHIGGVLGHNKSAQITMNKVVFDGSLTSYDDYQGGLVGWSDESTITLNNCLSKGSHSENVCFNPIGCVNNNSQLVSVTVTDTYYTTEPTLTSGEHILTDKGEYVYAEAPTDTNTLYGAVLAADDAEYYKPVTSIKPQKSYNSPQAVYDPVVTITFGSYTLVKGTDFTTAVELNDNDGSNIPTYTLTVTGIGHFRGTYTDKVYLVPDTIYAVESDGSSKLIQNFELIDENTTTLTGNCVVMKNVTNNNRLRVSGSAVIVLCDDMTLTAPRGISVNEGNDITIYGQTQGTGKYISKGATWGNSALGGDSYAKSGTITIEGGVLDVSAGENAAGIGGGASKAATVININGGTVTAKGGTERGAGIGGGGGSEECYGGTINITGGTISATGREVGIGNGESDEIENPISNCSINLSYTQYSSSTMSVYSNVMNGLITIDEGMEFFDGATGKVYNEGEYFNSEPYAGGSLIYPTGEFDGKTLRPNKNGWSLLQSRIDSAENGATITLDPQYNYSALSTDTTLVIPNGKTLTLDMNGCTLNRGLSEAADGGNIITNNGTLNIKGSGTFIGGNNSSDGGAIVNNGTLMIADCTFEGNSSEGRGGVIYNDSDNTVSIIRGTFMNNTAGSGGVIYSESNTTVTVNSGTFDSNKSLGNGGVFASNGTLTINRGTIANNEAEGNGGAVFAKAGTLNLYGGTIRNNLSGSNGGGIFARSYCTVNMKDAPVIKDNKSGSDNNNLFMESNSTEGNSINIVGTLNNRANIWVSGAFSVPITSGLGEYGSFEVFHSDSNYFVRENSEGEAIYAQRRTITVTTQGYGTASVENRTVVGTSASRNEAAVGDLILVTAQPDNSYAHVDSITCTYMNGDETVNVPIDDDEFTMPDRDVTVTVTFGLTPVSYKALDGTLNYVNDFTTVTSATQTMTTGWYVLDGNTTNTKRISVDGNVDLILCDGMELNAKYGITVNKGNSLTIWEQADGSGKLTIDQVYKYTYYDQSGLQYAGIGGSHNSACGTITINGGNITVIGGGQGAGIGSGSYTSDNDGTIIINAGTIKASVYNDGNAAAIGGGQNSGIGTIMINGGDIDARGGDRSAGIGGGLNGTSKTQSISITGGKIRTNGCTGGAGIGGGSNGKGGTIVILGGIIDAYGDSGALGIGAGKNNTEATIMVGYSNTTKADFSIKSSGYKGALTFTDPVVDGEGHVYGTGSVSDTSLLNNSTITPFDGIGAMLKGCSLSIQNDGDIGVNFYMTLGDEIIAAQDAKMKFEIPNKGVYEEMYIDVSDAETDGTYYVFKCPIAAKEMTSKMYAQVFIGDQPQGKKYEYTVKDYADYLIAHANEKQEYADALQLVKSMLAYGSAAQVLLDNNTEALADSDVEYTPDNAVDVKEAVKNIVDNGDLSDLEAVSIDENLTFDGSSLNLGSKTAYTLYYVKGSGYSLADPPAITCDGHSVSVVQTATKVRYDIMEITAGDLLEPITVTIGTATLKVNPASYFYTALSTTDESYADLRTAITAFYYFNEEVNIYKEAQLS